MARYRVFVDIDGVLTTERTHYTRGDKYYPVWSRFDSVAIDFFNKIDDVAGDDVEFVLTTTWKNFIPAHDKDLGGWNFHWIHAAFANAGFRGTFSEDYATEKEHLKDRAIGIRDYIEEHGVADFIIFDDNDYDFDEILGKKRWIRTDPDDGILYKHMKHAMSIVGNWR